LIEQDGEEQPGDRADSDIEQAENREVGERGPPIGVIEQALVVREANPLREVRQQLRASERKQAREQDEAVNEHQREAQTWRKHELRQQRLKSHFSRLQRHFWSVIALEQKRRSSVGISFEVFYWNVPTESTMALARPVTVRLSPSLMARWSHAG
jgi:hypothetical protein